MAAPCPDTTTLPRQILSLALLAASSALMLLPAAVAVLVLLGVLG